jgi:predicted enzyme related to lactoylglutathione lyase
MSERDGYIPGVPCWADTSQPDPQAALPFYSGLFGWEFKESMPEDADGHYFIGSIRGGAVAAVGSIPDGAPQIPMWNTYIWVESAADTAEKARGAGGAVLMEAFDVMDAGRMAVLVDPAGAAVCLWQARGSIGAEIVNEPVSLTWNVLMTPDVDAVQPFYEGLFGWKRDDQPMGDGPPYTLWMLGDRGVAGAMPPPMEGMPSFWGIYFSVDDADATTATAQELGANVLAGPMDIPDVGRFAALMDPQGAAFSVMKNATPGD